MQIKKEQMWFYHELHLMEAVTQWDIYGYKYKKQLQKKYLNTKYKCNTNS